MNLNFLYFFLIFTGFSFTSYAENVNQEMQKITSELEIILPFLTSEEAFSNKNNEEKISHALENLEKIFKNLKTHPEISTLGSSINQQILQRQMTETKNLFKGPKKNFARHKLNSSLGLCISCHEQQPKICQLKVINDNNSDHKKIDSFEKAEFLFTTRDYTNALAFYDNYIRNFKSSQDDISKLQSALNRKLSYFTRVNCSFENGIKSFTEDLKNIGLPASIREQIISWQKELAKDKPWEQFSGETATEKEMKIFLSKYVKPSTKNAPIVGLFSYLEVNDLIISGILYEFLNAHPTSKLVPELLYWLAKLDKRLNYNIFYSLGDSYLHECMEKYSKSPFAKKCYKEYEDGLIFSYTGSSGTELPEDEIKELKILKKKVGIK